MKSLFITIVVVLVVSCAAQEVAIKAKPHSRLSYSWVDSEGDKIELWIWSFEKLFENNIYEYKKIDAKLGSKYKFSDGETIEVKKSGVFVGDKNQGLLKGNYIFAKGKLEKGFIRTFR